MKRSKLFRVCIVALTCSGMLGTQTIHAAGISAHTPSSQLSGNVRDISLEEGGVLRGNVIDETLTPVANTPVVVTKQGDLVARTTTNPSGEFAVADLAGGVYEVHTTNGSGVFRLWAPRTAPPAASAVATVRPGAEVIRGQLHNGNAFGWLANPWVLAGIVAAAIAIPLALDDDDAS